MDHGTLLAAQRMGAQAFGQRVHAIRDDQWHLPTPCEKWDVRDLVGHLVYDNVWVPDLLAGRTIAEVGDRYEGDLLGDDPVGAWDRSIAAALDAFDQPGALEREVDLSFGRHPATLYIEQRTLDLGVHAWDLARAIGADERLPDDLVACLWERWAPEKEQIRASDVFAEPIDVPETADLQTRLVGLLGRRA
jgi:uncharacterized protein (TIGR03086 family)